jgi:Flp pilus assembly protein TadG
MALINEKLLQKRRKRSALLQPSALIPPPCKERGQATVELLLVLLVMVLLIFGAFGLGQGLTLKHALDVSAEKAARLLSIDPADFNSAETLIRSEVDANLLGGNFGQQVTIGLYDANTQTPLTPDDLAIAAFSYRFIVQVNVPFAADVPFLNLTNRTITAAHYGIVDRLLP